MPSTVPNRTNVNNAVMPFFLIATTARKSENTKSNGWTVSPLLDNPSPIKKLSSPADKIVVRLNLTGPMNSINYPFAYYTKQTKGLGTV